ncbi:Protein of unknown function DUF2505 [Ferrimonas balearica DSM 9799]|uniref:DUF2505 domain-containing protein n=1 Tax=Ferrimonas balearica (strain DSM 9799 / CCM 4581 / KCTC 23876 / PAT) TaxID=550540 RepID=E1SRZ3_FERBD|nr:DUF2505 domain-containing protein [Ferrimonas balearica]MBY6018922.1 DUF2505 domain-containing protein [Halomonas denitrificans]ADN74962.1 Protein of unknown function DUF2505 [Ferrimonas balearica DSM 9799]MBW3140765.1 DUF2505 domain-containing protein [Ferrimonas balearica]MBW3165258.1 DUF2505 domain-containing protein [Ferrimonas balearica]MBY5981531.1 DUF2505 domain-containing protein [Ferrimonas balearica]
MELTVTHDYDCPLEELVAQFRQPDAVKAKYQAIGADKVRILQSDDDQQQWRMMTVREVRSTVPGLLKSVVGERNQLEQSEHWQHQSDGSYHCTLAIQIQGVPLTIQGGMILSERDGGSRNTIRLSFDSKVPFIGKTLAQFAAKDSERLMAREYDYLRQTCQVA